MKETRFCACACASAVLPFFSCLSRLSSFPSAELAFGEPAPNTVFTSDTRLLKVVQVPGATSARRTSGRAFEGWTFVGPLSRQETTTLPTTIKPTMSEVERRILSILAECQGRPGPQLQRRRQV